MHSPEAPRIFTSPALAVRHKLLIRSVRWRPGKRVIIGTSATRAIRSGENPFLNNVNKSTLQQCKHQRNCLQHTAKRPQFRYQRLYQDKGVWRRHVAAALVFFLRLSFYQRQQLLSFSARMPNHSLNRTFCGVGQLGFISFSPNCPTPQNPG